MTADKRPLKVFLCHAHADRDPVRGLYTRLIKDGVDAWLDKAKLLPGQDWELEIRKAVREADVVVVCLSKQFNQAGFRQKEVRLALDTAMEKPDGEIFIIPARLEECDTLERLRHLHQVDLFEDDGYKMLMRALREQANKIGATIQIKKDWLPNSTSPRTVQPEPSVINQTVAQRVTPVPRIEVKKPRRKLNLKQLFARAGVVILGLTSILTLVLTFLSPPSQKAESTSASEIISIANTQVVVSPSPVIGVNETSMRPMPIVTTASISLPTEITDTKGVSMRLVPAGEFTMGSDVDDVLAECKKHRSDCQRDWFIDEEPPYIVALDAFYMDIYEVTNDLYKKCVVAGACANPVDIIRYNNSSYDNHPVVYVDWYQANTYCQWRDVRLPTEAEWEKAARGVDSRIFPWGYGLDCNIANYGDCVGDTTAVGNYQNGVSPYKIYDLAGNVWEWVSSLYAAYPYDVNDGREDFAASGLHLLRGGAWGYDGSNQQVSIRVGSEIDNASANIGFRCVRDAKP